MWCDVLDSGQVKLPHKNTKNPKKKVLNCLEKEEKVKTLFLCEKIVWRDQFHERCNKLVFIVRWLSYNMLWHKHLYDKLMDVIKYNL